MRRLRPLLMTCASLLAVAGLLAQAGVASAAGSAGAPTGEPRPLDQVVPAPTSATPEGKPYTLNEQTTIRVSGGHGAKKARRTADQLAELLRPSTGFKLPVTTRPGNDGIQLKLGGDTGKLGKEGYQLRVTERAAVISAPRTAGLFHGVQTLRQLLPEQIEARSEQAGPWKIAGGIITDTPRYGYRSAMLDVSRHFFGVDKVKRYIDQLALYKINKLHLHLSDDQGWRIAIDSWPQLTKHGGSTETGGGPGGYYTKAEYREIMHYAADRHLTVVPEIDMPGHTNAALSSYPELNCDGVAPPLYTGTDVGFSSLCVSLDRTYDFVDDVIRELAAMTPGRYLHIGGDEARSTSDEDFATVMNKVQPIVAKYGKKAIGWHQITSATPEKGTVAQYWGYDETSQEERDTVVDAAKKGTQLVISPADRAYIDMKYNKDTPWGLNWAGYVDTQAAYDWDPATYLEGAPEGSVLGVEAPMWTETIDTSEQLEFLAFPRLPGIAELGWSTAASHDWNTYRTRLAQQGPRWDQLGINYWHSPQVPWPNG